MSSAPAPLPYELRIGVTGHRRVADPARAAAAVDALLDYIQRTLESAAESPRGPAGPKRTVVRRFDTLLAHCVGLAWRSLPLGSKHVPPERRTPIEWVVFSPLA